MALRANSVLPEEFYPLFWDVDPVGLELERHDEFIIERLLQYTTVAAFHWLLGHYSVPKLQKVADHSRRLDSKSKQFWKLWFESASASPHA